MTLCVAMNLEAGMVFVSDTRTNAGVDALCQFGKSHVFARDGERTVVALSAGNLSLTQKVINRVREDEIEDAETSGVWNGATLFDVVNGFGAAMRRTQKEDGDYLRAQRIKASASLLVGGQLRGEDPRLFLVYPEGNFIESSPQTVHFQIGEQKYGRPLTDHYVRRDTPLDEALKCALVAFHWTMQSNLAVGPPLHILVYRRDSFEAPERIELAADDPYLTTLGREWDEGTRRLFQRLPDPPWLPGDAGTRAAPARKRTRAKADRPAR